MNEYITIEKETHVEFTEKRSVFIGHIYPIDTVEKADDIIQMLRKQYSDARHNVYAYRIGDIEKCSDDGEPQGTAGLPILSAIRKNDINNCIIVITRYFGGVLLGAPGLLRAYTTTATKLLESAPKRKIQMFSIFKITCTYSQYDKLCLKLKDYEICNSVFTNDIKFDVYVPYSSMSDFESYVLNAYNVCISCEHINNTYK